jgi:hypothetical protein
MYNNKDNYSDESCESETVYYINKLLKKIMYLIELKNILLIYFYKCRHSENYHSNIIDISDKEKLERKMIFTLVL